MHEPCAVYFHGLPPLRLPSSDAKRHAATDDENDKGTPRRRPAAVRRCSGISLRFEHQVRSTRPFERTIAASAAIVCPCTASTTLRPHQPDSTIPAFNVIASVSAAQRFF